MQVLVPVAEGFEEMEFAIVVNVLRRAGIDVVTAGIPGTMIKGSRGITMMMDKKIDDINMDDLDKEFDALVLVGGYPGYVNLGKSQKVLNAIIKMNNSKRLVAAICGAPSVLAKVGILEDKKATIYPGMEKEIPRPRGGKMVEDENILTAAGPGVAVDFALKIVERLLDSNEAKKVKKELVC